MRYHIKLAVIGTALSALIPLSDLSAGGEKDSKEQHSVSEESILNDDASTEASDHHDNIPSEEARKQPYLNNPSPSELQKNLHEEGIEETTTEEEGTQTGYMINSNAIGSAKNKENLEKQLRLSSHSFATDEERKGFIEQAAQDNKQEFTKEDIRDIIPF